MKEAGSNDNHAFRWGVQVQLVVIAMSSTMIDELFNHCMELIDEIRHWRQHPCDVIPIAGADMSALNGTPWAPFKMHGYVFKLEHDKKKKEYVLNFAEAPPADPPPKSKRGKWSKAGGAAEKPIAARPARARPQRKATLKRIWFNVYKTMETRLQLIAISSSLPARVRLMKITARKISRRIMKQTQSVAAYARQFVQDVTSAIPQIEHLLRLVAEHSPRSTTGGARLERRLFGAEIGLPIWLSTWTPIDQLWDPGLFGQRAEESEQLLA